MWGWDTLASALKHVMSVSGSRKDSKPPQDPAGSETLLLTTQPKARDFHYTLLRG